MQPGTRRYLVVILLLAAGAGYSWGQRLVAAERFESAQAIAAPVEGAAAGQLAYTYFVDVEGWYSVTPYEAAVLSETLTELARVQDPSIGEPSCRS